MKQVKAKNEKRAKKQEGAVDSGLETNERVTNRIF